VFSPHIVSGLNYVVSLIAIIFLSMIIYHYTQYSSQV
jgi:uncharacterized membrane protein